MPPPRSHPFIDDRSSGAALIIVLAFVVLLTGLVVAFFSRAMSERQASNSSANLTKVELFAQGAVDTIMGDLAQEIAAGSLNTTITTGTNTVTLSMPRTAANAVPGLALTGTSGIVSFAPNLLKRSAYNQPFYSGTNYNLADNTVTSSGTTTISYPAPNRAAKASTSGTSKNGRFISAARWNKALLLPKADPSSATDFTPVTTGSNAFAPPDWILVARDGSNPVQTSVTSPVDIRWSKSNAKTVVGRYAWTIYDEGGLLDMNVAGYPSGMTPLQVSGKGSLALADLQVVGLTQPQIDALVGWRNYASAQPPGAFPDFGISGTNIAINYYNSVSSNTKGFLATSGTAIYNSQSDRMFTSRQQLIEFLTTTGTLGGTTLAATQNTLQYLGSFSRDLEQPSFAPDPGRPKNTTHNWAGGTIGFGGNDAYDPTGAKQDLINPSLLTVRDLNGQPVMKRRFPLSRLALLDQAARTLRSGETPTQREKDQIYNYFGLAWDSIGAHWTYNHGDPNGILKLSEITGREPDFFETLKAVINCDSLGKQYGGTEGNSNPISPHQFIKDAAGIDGVVNYQLIRIGVNLIDQYDKDSYPTAIAFGTPSREFYGVENLPYLAGWMQSWYHMKQLTEADINPAKKIPGAGANGYPYETWMMFQPILWNPHAPDSNLDTTQVPTDFRVTAGSTTGIAVSILPNVRPAWWQTGPTSQYPAASTAPGLTPASWAAATLDPETSLLTFNATPNNSPNVESSFQEPYRLLYHFPAGSNADTGPAYANGKFSLDALGPVVDPVLAASDATVDGKTIIGFFGGKCWAGPWAEIISGATGVPPNCLSSGYTSTNDVQLTLQYKNAAGGWSTYDVINHVYSASVQSSYMNSLDNKDTGNDVRGFLTSFRTDPRTDRWGLFGMKTFPLATDPTGTNWPTSTDIQGAYVYKWPQGTTLSPKAGFNAGFIYRLSRNGSGMALVDWPNTTQYISDLMVNTNIGTTASYIPGKKFYYNDPDHVLRRASGAFFSTTTSKNTNEGLPLSTGNYASRPVVLNRPFQSVAEMGYAFSDTPWKEINFFAPESGDAALLDAFCLNELDDAPTDVSVAGRVNLNTRQPKVLEAIISGVSKAEGGPISSLEAQKAAKALVTWTGDTTSATATTPPILTKGPLRNRSELVGKFVRAVTYASPPSTNLPNIGYDGNLSYSGYSSMLTSGPGGVFSDTSDASIKRRRESVIRALADSGNARTWNLMIDVVAQVGRYPASATVLDNFVVEGEIRYWVHVAIDRYTGSVVAKYVEPVSE